MRTQPRRGDESKVTAKTTIVTKRGGIFVLLLPALLLLPVLHFHPAHAHTHGTHGAHQHPPLVHADFLPISDHNEGEHQHHHSPPTDHSSPSTPQVNFVTLPVRSLCLSLLVPEQSLVCLPCIALVVSSLPLVHTWLFARDHAPPVQTVVFSPSAPRAPPRFS